MLCCYSDLFDFDFEFDDAAEIAIAASYESKQRVVSLVVAV
jgi:hypothetical protein